MNMELRNSRIGDRKTILAESPAFLISTFNPLIYRLAVKEGGGLGFRPHEKTGQSTL